MMRRGLTLIDLLVVIVMIAILAALLFPVVARAREQALGGAREKAQQAACLNNIKQICLAAIMYTCDWDGMYPIGYPGAPPTGGDPPLRPNWGDGLYPYLGNWDVFKCPSDPKNYYFEDPALGWYGCSYGVNNFLNGNIRQFPSRNIYSLRNPARLCYMADCGYGALAPGWSPESPYVYNAAQFPLVASAMVDGNMCRMEPLGETQTTVEDQIHGTGSNFGFADGHAKWLSMAGAVEGTEEWGGYAMVPEAE